MKTIAIIGVGLIGGSLAIAVRERGLYGRVVGVEQSLANRAKALKLGLVDEFMELEQAVIASDLVVLAIPVDAVPLLAVKVLNIVAEQSPQTVVIDVGSTKEELCETIALHPCRGRFVASHPMWGTEFSGPDAAVTGAFVGRTAVICEPEKSNDDAVDLVGELYTALGMKIVTMSSEEHDLHAAYVSHISHITSFALALTVLEKEREEETVFDLAGGGFESTVRLAKSAASMWVPILMKNKFNVLDVLRENIHQLNILRRMIERDDMEGLYASIEKANTIKKIIN